MFRTFLLLLCLFVVGCASRPEPSVIISENPSDRMLTEENFKHAMSRYLRNGGGPIVSTYNIVLADLNGDHIPEGLLLMNTPFGTWCKAYGCTLFIFEQQNGVITLNSRIEQVRGPLFLHDTGNSWTSIITRQDGINREARYIALENKGIGYPAFTLNAPNYNGRSPHSGQSFFY